MRLPEALLDILKSMVEITVYCCAISSNGVM